MSSYSEYLGRLKQRIPNYIDTRPRRDAGHQTEVVKRLAASGVQESQKPTPAGVLVLNGPSTRVYSHYAKAHSVQDTSVYNLYTAGQAVAQSAMPQNAKPAQIQSVCCVTPEINDKMAANPELAKIIHAKQGLRADCCSMCGKVYNAAVCGCINRVPGSGGGNVSCEQFVNTQGMTADLDNPPPYENEEDDYGFYLTLGFPFYFYGTDYGSEDNVYYTSNHVIGFDNGSDIDTSYEDWSASNTAILVGFTDRDMDNFYYGPPAETRDNLTYFQGVLFGRNDHGDGIPNAVQWRYVIGRDEIAGYQYVEIDFVTAPEIVGQWDIADGQGFTGLFGSFAPTACTTILLRSDLDGANWTLLPGETLGVPLPPPTMLLRMSSAPKQWVRTVK